MIRSELRRLARWFEARESSAHRARANISLCIGYMVKLLANKGVEEHGDMAMNSLRGTFMVGGVA